MGARSCQGRAIKVNARESYDRIPAADHLWRVDLLGEGTKTPSLIAARSLMLILYGSHHGKRICSRRPLSARISNGTSMVEKNLN